MWIALGILGFLAALIAVLLLCPVQILIRSDSREPLALRYKYLWFTFGEESLPGNPIAKILKKTSGAEKAKKASLQQRLQTSNLRETVQEGYKVILSLVKHLKSLLKHCMIKKLHIKIRSGGGDPAVAAIHYGQYCALTNSLVTALRALLTVRKKGLHIDIGCDFDASREIFECDAIVAVRLGHVVAVFLRIILDELKRRNKKKTGSV